MMIICQLQVMPVAGCASNLDLQASMVLAERVIHYTNQCRILLALQTNNSHLYAMRLPSSLHMPKLLGAVNYGLRGSVSAFLVL